MEMNFCRRCGTHLTATEPDVYKCENGHTLFANAVPATGVLFVNDQKEVLVTVRKNNPGKGALHMPGGFCDGPEVFEDTLTRELREELQLEPDQYEIPTYLLTHIDPYRFGGEMVPVTVVVFVSKLKLGANPQPADDVASLSFMKYEDIDESKTHLPSFMAAVELLHKHGVI
jgi:ADP-ribose pyrophosphatase YjhB (NUDIX family)